MRNHRLFIYFVDRGKERVYNINIKSKKGFKENDFKRGRSDRTPSLAKVGSSSQ